MKKETLQEFLARGGKITILPPGPAPARTETMKLSSPGGPNAIMSLEDGELYYGEAKTRKAKKTSSAIDLSVHLPEALRKKYIDGILNVDEDKD